MSSTRIGNLITPELKPYIDEADGIIFVYDIGDKNSMLQIRNWVSQVNTVRAY